MSVPSVEWALVPLDRVRSGLLRVLATALAPLLRRRSARVSALSWLAVMSASALAVWAPAFALTVGPLVFGVPHLLGDLRYLLVRQGLHRRRLLLLAVAPCLALCVVQPRWAWGSLAVAVAALCARAPLRRRAPVVLGLALSASLAAHLGRVADLAFAHAHNALALYVLLRVSRAPRAYLPAAALLATVCALMLSGTLDTALAYGLLSSGGKERPAALVQAFSFDVGNAWSLRLLALFALFQGLHYAVWLRLVPEEDRVREGPRSFRTSYRALVHDVGTHVPLLLGLALLALWIYALLDVTRARDAYLRLALFHGPLELVALTLCFLEGHALEREPRGAHVV